MIFSLKQTAIAVAIAAGCASASALPMFTLDPAAAGLAGTSFNADNFQISNYSSTTFSAPGVFSQTGYLAVTAFQLGGATVVPAGLNTGWGLYLAFSGAGTTNGANPGTSLVTGAYTSLTYTLYGYNGSASFGFSGTTPTESASGEVVLATGSLISGGLGSFPTGGGGFSPFASVSLTVSPTNAGFFAAPTPFYTEGLAAFINTPSQVTATANGFIISQGGGSLNFAAPVPEPGVQMLLLSGLAAVGFIARRRRG